MAQSIIITLLVCPSDQNYLSEEAFLLSSTLLQVEANGENEHPIFKFLKKELPAPSDDSESLMSNPQFLIWRPIKRTDIAWNFEKFLIGPDGTPLKRYSR